MPRVASSHGASRPLLLGLLGLGGAGLVLLARVEEPRREPLEISALVTSSEIAQESELLLAASREGLAAGEASWSPALDGDSAALHPPREPRTEREYLDGFLALARTEPGALEARAREILDGQGASLAKVALLRAQLESGSPEAVRWLAYAVRTQPDESSAEARSVASYALDALAQQAAQGESARASLAALTFEEPGLSPGLRRRAASAWARHCSEAELDGLRNRLLHEPDALLVAGALASLAQREPTPRVTRILLDFPAAPAPATEE